MITELHNYDIFPKVFPVKTEKEICIKPLGGHADFTESEYTLCICPLCDGAKRHYPHHSGFVDIPVKKSDDGCIRFCYTFPTEQEYSIRIYKGTDTDNWDNLVVKLSVYAVEADLCGRYPFAGDLHMHTCRSDGRQAPAVVAANYRKIGYDFLAITDHRRYYPSLEAMDAFKDVDTEYTLVPGEEVHLPWGDEYHINDVHIVNFGAKMSINALSATLPHIAEVGADKSKRTIEGYDCPEPMSDEEYFKTVDEYAKTIDIPEGVEPFAYASCQWIFEQINKADGLSIFAHPYWISNVFQVPEKLSEALFENRKFGAFEVLGGESYYQQNGFQTVFYYEQAAKGNRVPIVGSTDSHSSVNNPNSAICRTIVFAPENERQSIINAIKDFYSVAVDTISTEYRMVGELRFVKYAAFLYDNFFPLHDELCIEEGRLLKEYACGDKDAARVLTAINGRMKKQREKYFSF